LGNRGQIVEQPRQATFENSLGMQLFQSQGAIVLENESSLIGKVFIPHLFRSQMKQAPLIILETSLQERIEAIFHEYVEIPLQHETPVTQLWEILGQNIKSLEKRLGGKDTALAIKLLQEGLSNPLLLEKQSPWIELLLVRYYDKAYAYALNRSQQKILFQGNKTEIKSWLIEKWASRKNG
jgi:tRNA 2-selenouridine synthase